MYVYVRCCGIARASSLFGSRRSARTAVRSMGDAAAAFEWLGPAEAVLKRPDMYVGSIEPQDEQELLFEEPAGDDALVFTSWTMSPIFRKIFDEVFVNALDAATRDESLRRIDVAFDMTTGEIAVENDGRGIPVLPFKSTGRTIPEVVFSELNAGSNFEDVGKRLGGGRNGVGVVCANVWSTRFVVEVHDPEQQLKFTQRFEHNMKTRSAPQVQKTTKRRGSVAVSFVPDYQRLGIDLQRDAPLLRKCLVTRCREGAVCVRRGVSVFFGGTKIPDSVAQYAAAILGTPAQELVKDEAGSPASACLTVVFGRRQRAQEGSGALGFVNGVRCCQGTHIRHVTDKLVRAAQAKIKDVAHVRPQTVKEVIGVVVVARIPDPAFSGQAKEALTTAAKSFGFCYEELSARAVSKLQKQGLFDEIARRETARDIASSVRKTQVPRSKDVLIDKYDAAIECRTNPQECTLILTEGDSAKALVVAGLTVVGRERFGVFPLRGVPLNVRNVPMKKCLDNKEISNVLKILNLAPGRSLEGLRYGRIAIMSDQDLDGSHIAALIINFVHCLLPGILDQKPDFLCRIVTPLLRATHQRTGDVRSFFCQQELDAWLETPESKSGAYKLKYYKGLGTNSAAEAKAIFSKLEEHTVTLAPSERTDDLVMRFFDESRVAERKQMLTADYDPKRCVDYSQRKVAIDRFLEDEVVHFSQYHVRRALASAIDGLTPARRKVLFYFLGAGGAKEVRVAQAAAGVSQKTCYHHGEASLVECIVGVAQDHVGTNNVALLEPIGQFGSRHDKPSVHAAARYIYTKVAPIAKCLFPAEDNAVLTHLEEEGTQVEPAHYVPVLPVVLLNGAAGIGTGFSTSVPCFSLQSLCAAARAIIAGAADVPPLVPHNEGFKGRLEITAKGVQSTGTFEREDDTTLVVTELPIGRWTESFMTELKESGGAGATSSKVLPPPASVQNLSTDTAVRVRIAFTEPISGLSDEQIASALKLSTSVSSTHMYLFDHNGKLKKYGSFAEIVREHAAARLDLYDKRKAYMLAELQRKCHALAQKIKFVKLVVDGVLVFRGQDEAQITQELRDVHAFEENMLDQLMDMPFRSCTAAQITKLQAEEAKCREAAAALEAKTRGDLWEEDIAQVERAHADYLAQHRKRYAAAATASARRPAAAASSSGRKRKAPPICK